MPNKTKKTTDFPLRDIKALENLHKLEDSEVLPSWKEVEELTKDMRHMNGHMKGEFKMVHNQLKKVEDVTLRLRAKLEKKKGGL